MFLAMLLQTGYDFWRDSLWQTIGVFVSILFGVTGVIFGLTQRSKKALGYRILSNQSIGLLQDQMAGPEIRFKRQPVNDLRLVVLELSNEGNVPILAGDIIQPVTITFGAKAQIVEVTLAEATPANLEPPITVGPQTLVIQPLLLNQGSKFRLKILLTGVAEDISIEATVVGVKEITHVTLGRKYALYWIALGLIACISSILWFIHSSSNMAALHCSSQNPSSMSPACSSNVSLALPALLLYVAGIVLLFWALLGLLAPVADGLGRRLAQRRSARLRRTGA